MDTTTIFIDVMFFDYDDNVVKMVETASGGHIEVLSPYKGVDGGILPWW